MDEHAVITKSKPKTFTEKLDDMVVKGWKVIGFSHSFSPKSFSALLRREKNQTQTPDNNS